MKRIFLVTTASVIAIFSFFTAFSEPNPNATSTLLNKKSQYKVESYGTDPGASPEIVKARLEALETEVAMTYDNTVQEYIDSYLKRGRSGFSNLLVLSAYYMPVFEKALQEAGLPDELKYLPIIESGLKPKATSNKGAGGLWQIMPKTAKGYDMEITSAIDERNDPYISSKKACEILKKQYGRFGDWALALAAYNAGAGTVQGAIRRAGCTKENATFQKIAHCLPAQTRKYVPKFIAMTYVMNYYHEHNIPKISREDALATDTVHITQKTSLRQVANLVGVDAEQIRSLNPHFRSDVIPGTHSRHCNLILPVEKVKEYKAKKGLPYDENRSNSYAAASNANKSANAAEEDNNRQAYTVLMTTAKTPEIDPNRFRRKHN